MKYLMIMILFNLFIGEPPINNIKNNKESTIIIVDSLTGEKLCGVYNSMSNEYSDLDGKMSIKNDSVDLKLISYKDVKLKINGGVIKMKPLN